MIIVYFNQIENSAMVDIQSVTLFFTYSSKRDLNPFIHYTHIFPMPKITFSLISLTGIDLLHGLFLISER